MRTSRLTEVLADLKEHRQLSSEVDEAIAPFMGKSFELSLSFVSSNRTIGNRFGPEYNDGVTLICALEADDLEISLQMAPAEIAFVEDLAADATFEIKVTLLDFDTLYQRAIFGSVSERDSPKEEPSPDEMEEEPIEKEPSVVAPMETIESEVEIVEPEIIESADPIEPEIVDPEIFESEIAEQITEEEEDVDEGEDSREDREELLSQLKETVDTWRADSDQSQTYEDELERVEYEGEEPEWIPTEAKPAKAPPPQPVSAPATTKEPEKQGCQNCSGCFKAIVVLLIIIFVLILVISFRKELETGTLTRSPDQNTPEETARHAFRKSALKTLGKKQPSQEDLFYLNETATMIWRKLRSKYHSGFSPDRLSALNRVELAGGYAWVALAAEADGRSIRAALYENSRRKHPFHLLDDWHLIEAKVRIRLKNPHIELDEKDLMRVKALDLSDEQPENFSYLNQLPNLKQLTLSDDQNSRKQAQAIGSIWPELWINYRKP